MIIVKSCVYKLLAITFFPGDEYNFCSIEGRLFIYKIFLWETGNFIGYFGNLSFYNTRPLFDWVAPEAIVRLWKVEHPIDRYPASYI